MNAIVVFVVFMVFMVFMIFMAFMVFMAFVVGRHVGRVIAIIIFMQRHVLQILDLGMNVAHFIADELHLMFVTGHMAIIAQFREGCDFFLFLFQYLSAHFFVFAKKRAQPCVASRGVANARRVLEQFLPYFVPSLHEGNVLHVVQCNSAAVARLMVAHGLSRMYVLYKMSDIKYIKHNAHNTYNTNHNNNTTTDGRRRETRRCTRNSRATRNSSASRTEGLAADREPRPLRAVPHQGQRHMEHVQKAGGLLLARGRD
jgi:hypothetical protein